MKLAYREAKARAAVCDEVNKVITAVAKSYSVWSSMLEAHIGRCFNGVDGEEYDSDWHLREREAYDTNDYNSEGEYIGDDDKEADGDSDW